jgi:hypothetical protein
MLVFTSSVYLAGPDWRCTRDDSAQSPRTGGTLSDRRRPVHGTQRRRYMPLVLGSMLDAHPMLLLRLRDVDDNDLAARLFCSPDSWQRRLRARRKLDVQIDGAVRSSVPSGNGSEYPERERDDVFGAQILLGVG